MPQKASGGHIANPLSKGDITFIANLEYLEHRDVKTMNRKQQEFH